MYNNLTVLDDTIVVIALIIGHNRDIMDHLESRADGLGSVRGFTPSDDWDHIWGSTDGTLAGQTAGLDVVVEGDWLGKLDQSNVVLKGVVVPVGVGKSIKDKLIYNI